MINSHSLSQTLSKIEKDKLPKVIFFFRHINDLDFSLPLVLFATNAKIIFYQKIDLSDRRVQLLQDHGITIKHLHHPVLDWFEIFIDFFVAFLVKIALNKAATFFQAKGSLITCFFLKKEMLTLANTKIFFKDVSIFCFDHTSCLKSKSLINTLRNFFLGCSKINIISVPHGANIFKNRMLDYGQIDFDSSQEDFSHFDHVICNDNSHFNLIDGKKSILDPLRYTKAWQLYLDSYFGKNIEGLQPTLEVKVLFLLSKFSGNINHDEVQRAIDIIKDHKNIKLKIKPHPRGLRELNRLNTYDAELVQGDVQEHIASVDCVINIQSNAVFDAYIQDKPVIFPAYMTSNDWLADIQEHAFIAHTPDDYLKCIQSVSMKEFPKTSNYNFPLWDSVFEKWINFFSSLK